MEMLLPVGLLLVLVLAAGVLIDWRDRGAEAVDPSFYLVDDDNGAMPLPCRCHACERAGGQLPGHLGCSAQPTSTALLLAEARGEVVRRLDRHGRWRWYSVS